MRFVTRCGQSRVAAFQKQNSVSIGARRRVFHGYVNPRVLKDLPVQLGNTSERNLQMMRRESVRDSGKYITIYQRQADDSCKIAPDIWNSNNPPITGR